MNFAAESNPMYDTVVNGATILSCNITTTKKCYIVIIALNISWEVAQHTQIQRGGVDKTVETTISGADFVCQFMYASLQYASEVLVAGTYQYDLVNTGGHDLYVFGSAMKIVAVTAT